MTKLAESSGARSRMRIILSAWVLAISAALGACVSNPTKFGISPYAWEEDKPAKRALEERGVSERRRHAVAYFPAEAVSPEERAKIVSALDAGIVGIQSLLGTRNWAFENDRRVHFYFPDGQFVSHAPGGNTVYIPLWRIREGKAPWLHEAAHLLLTREGHWLSKPDEVADARMPLWLEEGLAESVAMDVAARERLPYFSPVIDVAPEKLDARCEALLRTPIGKTATDRIGGIGKPKALFGPNRFEYAQPFYVCSASFVRYLVARHGYRPLLRAIRAFDDELPTLGREIGVPVEEAKTRWLDSLRTAPATERH